MVAGGVLLPTPGDGAESVLTVPRINHANQALVGCHAAAGLGSRRWETVRGLGHDDEHVDTLEGRLRVWDLLSMSRQAGPNKVSGKGRFRSSLGSMCAMAR